ncbi:hypothetical protein Slala03_75370 [Streptomyces lavendulae subsp. lavendulae]|nr:hypothetical protein Slala03_75370 [Streptomyces lavendulae subsp. lavendulae]
MDDYTTGLRRGPPARTDQRLPAGPHEFRDPLLVAGARASLASRLGGYPALDGLLGHAQDGGDLPGGAPLPPEQRLQLIRRRYRYRPCVQEPLQPLTYRPHDPTSPFDTASRVPAGPPFPRSVAAGLYPA